MARGLMIDVIAPAKGSEDPDASYESAEEAGEMEEAPASPKADPEALLAGIQAQLDQLRALMAGM